MFLLVKELKGKANLNVYLGFRDKSLVTCEKEFEEVGLNKLVVTTDDGSYKEKGYAIDFMKKDIEENKVDKIFACGPLPMLKAVRAYAIENNIPCQISLEERMGCGIGACLGCAIQIGKGENARYGHVCKDGPVFNAKDVVYTINMIINNDTAYTKTLKNVRAVSENDPYTLTVYFDRSVPNPTMLLSFPVIESGSFEKDF